MLSLITDNVRITSVYSSLGTERRSIMALVVMDIFKGRASMACGRQFTTDQLSSSSMYSPALTVELESSKGIEISEFFHHHIAEKLQPRTRVFFFLFTYRS